MAMLAVTQHTLELSEVRMEKSRQLCRQVEDARKAANDLLATLENYGLFKEVKLMNGVSKKLDQVLKKRGDALSADTDWYLVMEEHLRILLTFHEVMSCR